MIESYRSFTVILYDHNPLHLQKVWGSADCIMMKVSREYCNSNNLSNIEEFKKPCLYILADENEKAYIGQAKAFCNRVKDHLSKKDWWTRAYVFVSDSGRYHTASVEYLEYRAILEAQEAARYDYSENKQTPGTPTLPPHEHSQMNEALREIKYFLKYERCLVFEKSKELLPPPYVIDESEVSSAAFSSSAPVEAPLLLSPLFTLHCKGHVAKGYYINDGTNRFIVLKDSEIVGEVQQSFHHHKQRAQLLQHCSQNKEGKLILCEDFTFSSSSTASSCCTGASKSGLSSWKDSEGRTLQQYIDETKN